MTLQGTVDYFLALLRKHDAYHARAVCLLGCFLLTVLGLGLLPLGLSVQAQQSKREVLAGKPPEDVWSVAVSQDGKVMAAGAGWWDQPGEIGVWDLATGKPLQRFAEHLGVASVAFSPDGKLLASGSWTGHVRIRDWAAAIELADFEVAGVARVAFSPDGELLATATEQKTVQLWNVGQHRLLADLEGDLFRFHCLTFSPDGKRVLAGGGDWQPGGVNQVTIWDVDARKQVQTLIGHQNAVICIVFSPDGKTIATGGVDNTIRLWDADRGQPGKIMHGHNHWVENLVFTADGKTLVSASHDHTIRFWDVDQGKEKDRITMPADVRAVQFTPDGKSLIAGGAQKILKIFDAVSHAEAATLWDGSGARKTDMDELPVGAPLPGAARAKVSGGRSLAWVLGLGLLLILSFLGAWLYNRRRRDARQRSASAPGQRAEANAAPSSATVPASQGRVRLWLRTCVLNC